jgi:hypothetical protein
MRKQSTCDVCSKRQTVAVGFGKAQGRTALLLRLVHRNVSAVTSTSQSRPYVATESSTSGILVSIAMVKDLENRVTYSTAPVVGNTKGTAPATRSACITAVEFWPAQSVSDAPNSYRSPGRVIVGSSRSALWRSEFAATTISSKPGCSLTSGTGCVESPREGPFGDQTTSSKLHLATPSHDPSLATAASCRV